MSVSHPLEELKNISKKIGHDINTVEFARHMDSIDPLGHLRNEFHYPKNKTLAMGKVILICTVLKCI